MLHSVDVPWIQEASTLRDNSNSLGPTRSFVVAIPFGHEADVLKGQGDGVRDTQIPGQQQKRARSMLLGLEAPQL